MNTKKTTTEKITMEDLLEMFAMSKREAEARQREAEARQREAEAQEEARRKEEDVRRKEEDARRKEEDARRKEEDARRKELAKGWAETKRIVDKLCGKVGGIETNIGNHAEQFFQDSLAQSLTFGGEKYDYMVPNLKYIGKKENGEFDIVLINGKSVALIEVKNRIHPDFVKELAEKKVERFRKYFKTFGGHKAYLGVAGFSFCEEVMGEARKYGVAVIKQSGKSIEIEADHLKAY